MKKLMILLVLAALVPAGCGAPAADVVPQQTLQPASPIQEALTYQVETRLWEDAALAEDGTVLASYSFHLPEMTVLTAEGVRVEAARTAEEETALVAAETFNQRFLDWLSDEELDSMAQEAAQELAWFRESGTEWFGGYRQELTVSTYQTEHLVSLEGTYYSYAGGAHPNTWHLGWNFDLDSGMFFGAESLAADSAEFQTAVLEELISQADARAAENGLEPQEFFWADYRDILANWSSYAVCFDPDGMLISFSPYELASYAAGTQSFRLSYEWLLPYLSQHGLAVLELTEE